MSVLMVMAVTLPIVVMVVVSVLVAMAFSMLMVVMVMMAMLMVVSAGTFDMLVELVVEAGVVHCVEHPVPELVFLDIEDGAHEGEVDLLLGFQ